MTCILTALISLAIGFVLGMIFKKKREPEVGDMYVSLFNFNEKISISNVGIDNRGDMYVEYHKYGDPSFPYIKGYKAFCRDYVNIKWRN